MTPGTILHPADPSVPSVEVFGGNDEFTILRAAGRLEAVRTPVVEAWARRHVVPCDDCPEPLDCAAMGGCVARREAA